MKKLLSIILIGLISVSLIAQDRVIKEKKIVTVKLSKPFATLKNAEGWSYYPYNDEWLNSNNYISGIDTFRSFSFSLATYDGKTYLFFNKLYTQGFYKYKHIERDWTTLDNGIGYLFLLEDYKEKVRTLHTDNILEFDLINHQSLIANTKPSSISADLAPNNLPQDKLVLKFRLNKEKNTARFLFYRKSNNYILDLLSQDGDERFFYKGDKEYLIITSDLLYENYYYEMDYNKFLEFIQAPLSK